ncbi:MAG: SGNH/GDSL hydrolase family protein [Calditrichaceae bacterium]
MYKMISILILIVWLSLNNCYQKSGNPNMRYAASDPKIKYFGRIDFNDPEKPRLSGPGSYIKFSFEGPTCEVLLNDENLYNQYNYISIELDDQYKERFAMDSSKQKYQIASGLGDGVHTALICKATEAGIGYVEFSGIVCQELVNLEEKKDRLIEYVGNSITCGMGLDTTDVSCHTGQWYDQHNAYLSYGPLTARALNADWILSSVSGIGMTRFWNTDDPTMPQVYDNLYLNNDTVKVWNPKNFQPDMVSICLGQNDFSDGEGPQPRAALDSTQFAQDYIGFLKRIRKRYPDAQIACISSPMIDGKKKVQLFSYLSAIAKYMREKENETQIHVFEFAKTYNKGCDWHPSREEHVAIAQELRSFYKKIMGL